MSFLSTYSSAQSIFCNLQIWMWNTTVKLELDEDDFETIEDDEDDDQDIDDTPNKKHVSPNHVSIF